MSTSSKIIFVLLLAIRCCTYTSSLRLFEGSIEINLEFLRVAPWALLLIKHRQSNLSLRCSLPWWLTKLKSFVDTPLDAFDMEGMTAVIQGHLILEWVNERHLNILFVRIVENWVMDSRPSTERGKLIFLFELIYNFIQKPVANVALSISEQDARAQLLIGTSKGRESILICASIGVLENQTFARSLREDRENHISKLRELDVFIMLNNMV